MHQLQGLLTILKEILKDQHITDSHLHIKQSTLHGVISSIGASCWSGWEFVWLRALSIVSDELQSEQRKCPALNTIIRTVGEKFPSIAKTRNWKIVRRNHRDLRWLEDSDVHRFGNCRRRGHTSPWPCGRRSCTTKLKAATLVDPNQQRFRPALCFSTTRCAIRPLQL
jgi:hypothetical protein